MQVDITGIIGGAHGERGGATQTASGATSPITVGSLTNAKTYTCTVLATNTVALLTAGKVYTCRVTATNTVGTSALSNQWSFTD